jgi:nitric oxide dioxygenase
VSTLMHDGVEEGAIVEVTAPMGEFSLKRGVETPVVLISGGVGITPMMSMASTLVAEGSQRDVRFVHACRSGAVHAFRDWLNDTVREHADVKRTVLYERVGPNDRAGIDHDLEGRLTPERVQQYALVPDADYYICGPIGFMKAQRDALVALGVAPERVNTEIFGSGALE